MEAKILTLKFNFRGVPVKIREISQRIRVRASLECLNQLRNLERIGAQFYVVSYLVAISEQVELPQPNVGCTKLVSALFPLRSNIRSSFLAGSLEKNHEC